MNYENRIKKLEEALLPPVSAPALSPQERRTKILQILRPMIERIEDPDERRSFRSDLRTDFDVVTDEEAEEFCNVCYHALQLSRGHNGGQI